MYDTRLTGAMVAQTCGAHPGAVKRKRLGKGWTCQNMERKQLGEGHSPSETTGGCVEISPYALHLAAHIACLGIEYHPHRGQVLLLPDRRSLPAALHQIHSPDYLRDQEPRAPRGHHFHSRSGMKSIKQGARTGDQGEVT